MAWLRSTLDERVADVSASERLLDSPVLAVNADAFTPPHMRRAMSASIGDGVNPLPRVQLEINPRTQSSSASLTTAGRTSTLRR
jgi:molecular chaperone HtpG